MERNIHLIHFLGMQESEMSTLKKHPVLKEIVLGEG